MTNPVIQTELAEVLGQINGRLDKLSEDVAEIKVGQSEIKGELKTLDERLSGQIKAVDQKLSGQIKTLDTKVEQIDKRV